MRSKGLATSEPSMEIVVHGHQSGRKQASVMKPNLEEARLLRSNDREVLVFLIFLLQRDNMIKKTYKRRHLLGLMFAEG